MNGRLAIPAVVLLATVGVAVGLYLFQPWRIFTSSTVTEGLDTSDGPDLRVWLSDAPVIEGAAGWYVFDDGAYLDLGAFKANKGDQNYEIPLEANLPDYSSVSIWCARFAVSLAAAELTG